VVRVRLGRMWTIDRQAFSIHAERDRFELSYATRLNRTVGLYFGWLT
jgi:hypothetical protein